jgi:hypothetical protein
MIRNLIRFAILVVLLVYSQVTYAELVGYWSADATGGVGDTLPNNQGDGSLDGELFEVVYTSGGQGHTGAARDFALEFPGEDTDFVAIPPTERTFEEITITAWVKGEQTGAWSGIVVSRDGSQPIGIDYHASDGQLNYIWNNNSPATYNFVSGLDIPVDEWTFVALTVVPEEATLYVGAGGTLDSATNAIPHDPQDNFTEWRLGEDDCCDPARNFLGLIDDVSIWDEALSEEQLNSLLQGTETPLSLAGLAPRPDLKVLFAGDADQDLDFDQLDLVRVQIAGKYLTGQAATWGEGDWDGAPGGTPGNPPPGDSRFNQLDIIAALNANSYLKGPYAALAPGGRAADGQTSIVYNAVSGEVAVDAPAGINLTSVNIDSAAGIFTGQPAQNLGGSFDNDSDGNIFKATFGSSFGSLSFGNVAQAGLSEQFVLSDLTAVGSLAGGGALGNVDLVYIPEPSAWILLAVGVAMLTTCWAKAGR